MKKYRFEIKEPDYDKSPFTGMTRKHWIEAGLHLLEGVFNYVKEFHNPIILPKKIAKIYPQENDPDYKFRSAEFEGLARTFIIASGIINIYPDIKICGINLRDYYFEQILNSTNPSSSVFWGFLSELSKKYNTLLFQHTAEGAALCIGLLISRKVIWDNFTPGQKDQVAKVLSDYAHWKTNSHNWRWFNVIMAEFLRKEGYPVDEEMINDHLQNILAFYSGDGWYRDMGNFDYYSSWAFQFYGPIWCRYFGYESRPEIARIIEERHCELMKTYPYMFSKRGYSFMWGRSIIYRCAASAPLVVHFMLNRNVISGGLARRIASGNLLQFITMEDFYDDGVPSIGFYRQFEPLVQSYSCAASPFWLGKIFVSLALEENSPFWAEKENASIWNRKRLEVINLPGPGLCITSDIKTGCSELRPGRVDVKKGDPNYTKLSYNTDFLWEDDRPDGPNSMCYTTVEKETGVCSINSTIKYAGMRGGVLYRQTALGGWLSKADLADIIIDGGVIRVDRFRIPFAYKLYLGHYGLPHINGKKATVERKCIKEYPAVVAYIEGRAVALVGIYGWDGLNYTIRSGCNPEADESTLIYAYRERLKQYSGMFICITLMLYRTDGDKWSDEELDIVKSVEIFPYSPSGSPFLIEVLLQDKLFVVDYGNIESEAIL